MRKNCNNRTINHELLDVCNGIVNLGTNVTAVSGSNLTQITWESPFDDIPRVEILDAKLDRALSFRPGISIRDASVEADIDDGLSYRFMIKERWKSDPFRLDDMALIALDSLLSVYERTLFEIEQLKKYKDRAAYSVNT